MKRDEAARIARETIELVERGGYEVNGRHVSIGAWVAEAVAGTTNYPGHEPIEVPPPPDPPHATTIEVRNERTLAAARRLVAESGEMPAALNFASAYHPGGGFLTGARAQEESLARSSALYACLRDQPMYAHHEAHRDPMYTAWVIHSPAVPVIRTDDGELLAEPYRCAFLTSAAVNAGVVLERNPTRTAEIEAAMRDRIDRVLRVAARHGHETLILGAWGCGVFRNDPSMIAGLFREALAAPDHRGRFRHVCFAILDPTPASRIITPYQQAFPGS